MADNTNDMPEHHKNTDFNLTNSLYAFSSGQLSQVILDIHHRSLAPNLG